MPTKGRNHLNQVLIPRTTSDELVTLALTSLSAKFPLLKQLPPSQLIRVRLLSVNYCCCYCNYGYYNYYYLYYYLYYYYYYYY